MSLRESKVSQNNVWGWYQNEREKSQDYYTFIPLRINWNSEALVMNLKAQESYFDEVIVKSINTIISEWSSSKRLESRCNKHLKRDIRMIMNKGLKLSKRTIEEYSWELKQLKL